MGQETIIVSNKPPSGKKLAETLFQVGLEGIDSIGKAMVIFSMIRGCATLAGHDDFELPLSAYIMIMVFIGALTGIDVWQHFIRYMTYDEDEEFVETPADNSVNGMEQKESKALLPKVSEPLEFKSIQLDWKQKAGVWICTISCSLDKAGIIAVLLKVLAVEFDIDLKSKDVIIAELVGTGVTAAAAIYAAPTIFTLQWEHVQKSIAAAQYRQSLTCPV